MAATVAVLTGVAISGAFHEDGLADTCDALGGYSPERRREILKDPRHGSFGVAAVTGLARRAFGGVGGDVLGTVEQVGEGLVLVIVVGLAAHHDLWWR